MIYFTLFLLGFSETLVSAAFDIYVNDALKMQEGLGWPHVLNVVEGHEILLKLKSKLDNEEHCRVTTPAGQELDIAQPTSNRYERWQDSCSVRVRNVSSSDHGRWRLTASAGDSSIVGWTEVYVVENTQTYNGSSIYLMDGETNANVDLTSLDNAYCVVTQPFSTSSLVPGHCKMTLDKTTRAVQGNWNVLLGLPGRVSELVMNRHVSVEAERLDTGYVHDANLNKLNLYCNMVHTAKNVTFCRFQKTAQNYGFNIMDGLSDGSHSYYGEGFSSKQCGMTIEHPTPQDAGTWRCSVGLQEIIGSDIIDYKPMEALISVASYSQATFSKSRSSKTEVLPTVFVQEGATFSLMCDADVSLSYCYFQHPDGSQFTPTPLVDDQKAFWYTGQSLQVGECGITFANATFNEAGKWRCHMGPSQQMGVEIIDVINVRVTGPLAASQKDVTVSLGEPTSLHCHTSNGNRPLKYCRFLMPDYVGINVDESVTQDLAILGRIYFSPDRTLDHGDCSIEINSVTEEDLGEWTCAALVDDEMYEARDTVVLYVENITTTSKASIAGVVILVGISALVIVLGGFLIYKYSPIKYIARTRRTETRSNIELEMRSNRTDITSLQNNPRISASTVSNSSDEIIMNRN